MHLIAFIICCIFKNIDGDIIISFNCCQKSWDLLLLLLLGDLYKVIEFIYIILKSGRFIYKFRHVFVTTTASFFSINYSNFDSQIRSLNTLLFLKRIFMHKIYCICNSQWIFKFYIYLIAIYNLMVFYIYLHAISLIFYHFCFFLSSELIFH